MRLPMRPAVLSIATERVAAPTRNAILAHAGYGVIPASDAKYALKILSTRHVCAMIVTHSISAEERQALCAEAHSRGVASVVLDPYGDLGGAAGFDAHFNPLDGPQAFLDVVASLLKRDHRCPEPSDQARRIN